MARAVRGETLPGTNADAELAEARVMAQASFMAACLVVAHGDEVRMTAPVG